MVLAFRHSQQFDCIWRTLVLEDNPAFRARIERALQDLPGRTETSSFAEGAQALACLREARDRGERFDLALVDVGLPDMSGIDAIRLMRSIFPDIPVLVISVMTSERTLMEAIRAGARGYILKDETEQSITDAIREVRRGNYPVSPALARTLFRLAGAPDAGEHQQFQLSPREITVLQNIALGLSYHEISEQLGVSMSTIQTYIRGLYRKLDVHSRHAAVNRGRAIGVI